MLEFPHPLAGSIDESRIPELVALFYGRVRADPDLGPIFNAAIDDWPRHLGKLADFWSSVMLSSGRYKGNPMSAHMKHQLSINPGHFDRWLMLWRDATSEVFGGDAAALFEEKANRIAESLKLALFYSPSKNG